MSRILVKTAIPRGPQRWDDVRLISAHRIYDGFLNSHFCALRDFEGPIFRIATADGSHFGRMRPFLGAPTVGGLQSDFRPPKLRGVFKIPILRFMRF